MGWRGVTKMVTVTWKVGGRGGKVTHGNGKRDGGREGGRGGAEQDQRTCITLS